jgi:hypothetical protein
MVQGDLIIPESNRIMTRSKTKTTPDQYTQIPVPLKIVKVLIEDLASAAGNTGGINSTTAGDIGSDGEGDDDGDWEDVPVFDLGLPATKQELMAFGDGTGSFMMRQRDDETGAFLVGFFREVSAANIGGFSDLYAALKPEEQQKLNQLGQA